MNLSTKLFEDRIKDKIEMRKRSDIASMIKNNYFNDNPYDSSIYQYFHIRYALEAAICSDYRWEVTRTGFETRTNYEYNHETGEITFIRHRIVKKGDHYNTNGTELANQHLKENFDYLERLARVQRIIDSYYKMYQEGIDRDLREDNRNIKRLVEFEEKSIKGFTLRYGDMGIALLTKWLNKLNDPYRTLDELLEEYLSDVNNAVVYYEAKQDAMYLDGVKSGYSFEKELLKRLKQYSPRAKKLESLYIVKKQRQRGLVK